MPSAKEPSSAELDVHRYRRRRDRRRLAEHRRAQLRSRITEVEDILTFARRWAHFGGPPEEEVFINFGMHTGRFTQRLWQIIRESDGNDSDEYLQLRKAYPPPYISTRHL